MNRCTFLRRACIASLLFLAGTMVFAIGSRQQSTAGGRQTLQIGIETNAFITDYKNNYLTRYLERLHDIDLDFYLFPSNGADARTRASLLAASDDLPETLWGTFIPVLVYGSDGAILPLNSYFNDPAKTPWFNRIPQADRTAILRDTRSADGNNYSFAQYEPSTWNMTPFRYYINRSWLDKLGLQEPKTTVELKNVLIAFRDGDPNGNGRQDEIGVFGHFTGGYGVNVIAALINSFIYWNPSQLALDSTGNNVIAPFTQSAFRTALQYLNDLFRERLLDASTFTTDQQTYRAVLNTQPMVVGLTSAGSIGHFSDANNNPNFLAMAPIMAPLSSPISPGYTPYNEYTASQISFITNKARNVDLAVKVMDSFYEPDLSIIARAGEEGVDWTRDPAIVSRYTNAYVQLGLYPALTRITIRDQWTGPTAQHWHNTGPRYSPLSQTDTGGDMANPYDPSVPSSQQDALNYMYYIPRRPQYILPQLSYNADDGITLSTVTTNMYQYVMLSIAEFTVGARDINSDTAWNAYLRELDNMGLQQWLRIAQATYNRQR